MSSCFRNRGRDASDAQSHTIWPIGKTSDPNVEVRKIAGKGIQSQRIMKQMIRSVRRFHRRRMMRHARRIFVGYRFPEALRAWAEKNHDHLCRCPCYMCHNKRKKFGPTIQERRLFQDDQVLEFEHSRVENADGRRRSLHPRSWNLRHTAAASGSVEG